MDVDVCSYRYWWYVLCRCYMNYTLILSVLDITQHFKEVLKFIAVKYFIVYFTNAQKVSSRRLGDAAIAVVIGQQNDVEKWTCNLTNYRHNILEVEALTGNIY